MTALAHSMLIIRGMYNQLVLLSLFVYVECLEQKYQVDFLAKSENAIRESLNQKCREATSATAAIKDDKRDCQR